MTEKNDINGEMSYDSYQEEDGKSGKKPRGSRYRGVSRNGNQWQV